MLYFVPRIEHRRTTNDIPQTSCRKTVNCVQNTLRDMCFMRLSNCCCLFWNYRNLTEPMICRCVGRGSPPVWHVGDDGHGDAHTTQVVAAATIPLNRPSPSSSSSSARPALVTASKDGDMRVWDLQGNCVQHIPQAHTRHTFINPR